MRYSMHSCWDSMKVPEYNKNMQNKNSIVCRNFQLTLISAGNLNNVRRFFGMKVYAKVSFNGNRKTEKRTPVDKHNGINPAWNFSIGYKIAETGLQHDGLMLVVKLYCKRKLGRDRYIGEVHMQVRDLFNYAIPQGLSATLSLKLQKGSAPVADHSVINISYRFGDRIEVKAPPLWQKVLRSGAVILFRVTLLSTLGVDMQIPIIKESEIIN